jgi:pimeloyl-ACP methyl ester carboxylesterase
MSAMPADGPCHKPDAPGHGLVRDLLAMARRHETPHAGGRVTWREWGMGPPLVLLHGGFGSWLHWVRNIGPLAARYRVLAADLPGLGDSDAVAEAPSAESVARPLVEGIRQLVPDGAPVRMACFSLGAVIGAQAATMLGHRVERVALLGPSGLGDLWRNVTGNLIRRRPDMSEAERRETIRHNLLHSMIADPDGIDDMALDIQSDLLRQKRKLIGLPISLSGALSQALPGLASRLTVIWGERDVYPSPDVRGAIAILRDRLPAIDFRLVDRAGHWVAYEAAHVVNPMLIETLMGDHSR